MTRRIFVVSAICFMVLTLSVWLYSVYLRVAACQDYELLDGQWRELVLKHVYETDVRGDGDQLLELGSFAAGSGPSVQNNTFSPSGAGWDIRGSLVDIVSVGNETFLLFGKENVCHYPKLLSDRRPDWNKTFAEVVLVKDASGTREVVHTERLGSGNRVYAAGLRVVEDGKTVEVLHGGHWPDFEVIYSYRDPGTPGSLD